MTVDRALGPAAFGLVISAYSLGTLGGALLGGRRMSGRLAPPLLLGNLVVAFAPRIRSPSPASHDSR